MPRQLTNTVDGGDLDVSYGEVKRGLYEELLAKGVIDAGTLV